MPSISYGDQSNNTILENTFPFQQLPTGLQKSVDCYIVVINLASPRFDRTSLEELNSLKVGSIQMKRENNSIGLFHMEIVACLDGQHHKNKANSCFLSPKIINIHLILLGSKDTLRVVIIYCSGEHTY